MWDYKVVSRETHLISITKNLYVNPSMIVSLETSGEKKDMCKITMRTGETHTVNISLGDVVTQMNKIMSNESPGN